MKIIFPFLNGTFRTPNSSLIYFDRVYLDSGEKKMISMVIDKDMMGTYNKEGVKVIEPGNFKIFVGGSSPGERSFKLGKEIKEVVFTVE